MNIQFNEARKTFRKTFYDLQQKMKKEFSLKQNHQWKKWKKGTTCIAGDSM